MIDADPRISRRARRLVRVYPKAWRSRYGAEFEQFLIDDMLDRPRSPRRTVDVVCSAAIARLGAAGLNGDAVDPEAALRAGLAWLGLALCAFAVAGLAIWSQLAIDWQWSAPAAPTTRAGMLMMTVAMAALALLAVLTVVPLAWHVAWSVARGPRRDLAAPLAAVAVGGLVLVAGSLHFDHGWPGTGGHPWDGREIVPASIARTTWAATLWMTSYWAHPTALKAFPGREIAWMVASPLALLTVCIGAGRALRRCPPSVVVLRYLGWLGAAAAIAMIVFLSGAGSWFVSGQPGPHGLFRAGVIDGVELAALTGLLILAVSAVRRSLGVGPQRSENA